MVFGGTLYGEEHFVRHYLNMYMENVWIKLQKTIDSLYELLYLLYTSKQYPTGELIKDEVLMHVLQYVIPYLFCTLDGL